MKILTITEKIPHPAKLRDGHYVGSWSGSTISLRCKDKWYELKTVDGLRGTSQVVVTVVNGVATFKVLSN